MSNLAAKAEVKITSDARSVIWTEEMLWRYSFLPLLLTKLLPALEPGMLADPPVMGASWPSRCSYRS